jgi:uncharacterized protein (TIGR00299 family) protein
MSDPAALRGLHLHVDCASGAAGDMMLGALIDLGVPIDVIGAALDAIGAGRDRLQVTRVVKHGIAAVDLKVRTDNHSHGPKPKRSQTDPFVTIKLQDKHVHVDEHGDKTEEHHHHHAHHRYADIRARIESAALTDGTRTRALDIFDRIARAEAKLHGMSLADVSFHEVGAIDSIVDVVGTAAALDYLAPSAVTCSSVAMGHGTVNTSHGVLPVPAPAALEVLREASGVMVDGGVARELCTPTGAAILASAVTAWQPSPPARALAVGWGAGDVELEDRANVLRVVALAPATAAAGEVWQIDANVDDMSPELCAPAIDAIFLAGALDAWWTPIQMKKGRPALLLSALVESAARDRVIAAILRETTTIGVRYSARQRTVLVRKTIEVETRFGMIPVKVAMDGDSVLNAAPEYEACAASARVHGVPVKLVYAAALAAYENR